MANLLLIRDLSKKRNITIRMIANQVGITDGALQNMIKNGRTNTETLEKIATVLNVPVGIFFDDFPNLSTENSLKVEKQEPSTESRMFSIIESQQRTIETLSNKIKER